MKIRILSAMFLAGMVCDQAWAAETYLPDQGTSSVLISSTQYYTEMAGLGLGTAVNMTGGGYGGETLGGPQSDDGFTSPINFGFSFSFFGSSYSSFYINNNGNISFNSGNTAYTPDSNFPVGASQPIIAPFFADVDTRGTGSVGAVYLNQTVTNQAIVTWDQVGYYNQHMDLLNSFQLVVRGASYTVPVGEGTIGFFWKTMGWETGDKSSGANGFGGSPAAVGFGNGVMDLVSFDNSMLDGISGVVQNHHVWFNVNAQGVPEIAPSSPPPVPEPETYAMLLAGLGLLGVVSRRRSRKRNI